MKDSETSNFGFVYFVRMIGIKQGRNHYFKIGMSLVSPMDRLDGLQIGNPFELELYGVVPCHDALFTERQIHHDFSFYRIRNLEWFLLPLKMVDDKIKEKEIEFRSVNYYLKTRGAK